MFKLHPIRSGTFSYTALRSAAEKIGLISISSGLPYSDGEFKTVAHVEFDTMDEEKLIIEVEKHKMLYDKRNADYFDSDKKAKIWEEIGNMLGFDGE